MSRSRRELWLERRKLQWKLRHGFKITKQELSNAKEIEELVKLLQLLKTGSIVKEEESFLRKRAGKIICDLVLEIIDLQNEPMKVEEIACNLLNAGDDLLKSAGYFVIIEKVMGEKVPPMKFVRDLLSIWRDKPESLEITIGRLLSRDARFIKVEQDLFVSRNWSPNKLFKVYVRLASEYRLLSPKKKRKFIGEAIELLETGKADFPNKDALIETLKRM
ncbi:MAG: hypothetical protein E3J73_05330 [Candidatus Bathyarchaeum sp.]|nr:MAG: hypothetical protein E3J73_05330 [Candidatus Bathyarchaeum sp.]